MLQRGESDFVNRERALTGRKLRTIGGVNRLKKANRWLNFVDKGIGSIVRPITEPIAHAIGQRGVQEVGGVNRLKKANRWLNFVDKGIGSIVRPITEPIARAVGQRGAREVMGAGKKPRATRKPSARGAIVAKIMKERGCSLAQASKCVKEEGLY
jgi:hypothetical protein